MSRPHTPARRRALTRAVSFGAALALAAPFQALAAQTPAPVKLETCERSWLDEKSVCTKSTFTVAFRLGLLMRPFCRLAGDALLFTDRAGPVSLMRSDERFPDAQRRPGSQTVRPNGFDRARLARCRGDAGDRH